MRPHDQLFEIANAVGCKCDNSGYWMNPDGRYFTNGCPPDYVTDLNAMLLAQRTLSTDQRIQFVSALNDITKKNPCVSMWHLVDASAAERAEAFLRTIGKWADGKGGAP